MHLCFCVKEVVYRCNSAGLTVYQCSRVEARCSDSYRLCSDSDTDSVPCSVYESSDDLSSDTCQTQTHLGEVNVVLVKYPDECLPKCCMKMCSFMDVFDKTVLGKAWFKYRMTNFTVVEHKYFETFIIVMILASSLALASSTSHTDRSYVTKWTKLCDTVVRWSDMSHTQHYKTV